MRLARASDRSSCPPTLAIRAAALLVAVLTRARRRYLSVGVVIGSLLLAPTSGEPQSVSGPQTTRPTKEERRELRQRQFLEAHTDEHGRVRPDLWRQGVEQLIQMKAATSVPLAPGGAQAVPSGIVGGQWTQIGPAPLRIDKNQNFQGLGPDSGEVVDIAIDPRNTTDQVIYIATNDGGIWKSTDGGVTWTPKTDPMLSLSMGAVALDSGNPSIVYAGTGNIFDGSGVFFKGVGIYKSVDAGETWIVLNPGGMFNNRGINRIVLPAPNVLLVATNVGLFRSVDGGLNFGSNAPTFDNRQTVLNGFVSDLDVDTASATIVYASVSGSGIFRSTDGGITFQTNLFSPTNGAPTAPFGNIAFAQSTLPDNRTIYASVAVGSNYKGLFKSTDGGTTWAVRPAAVCPGNPVYGSRCQGVYDLTVGVDSQDANRVYIGFQDLFASVDGGSSFADVTFNKVHSDHHALVFSPGPHIGGGPPTRLYVGTDGGIATSGNGGGSWANINETIATNLFTSIDVGRGNAVNNGFTFGGTQDTGTIEHRPDFPGTDWHLGIDGDGGGVAVDPLNPNRVYGADDGILIFTNDAGNNWALLSQVPLSAWRYAIDPNLSCGSVSCTVYMVTATNSGFTPGPQLWRSTDGFMNVFLINDASPKNIRSIANVRIDPNRVWLGLTDGTLQRTANALAATPTWTPITVTGAPNQPATGIAIDPSNPDQVVVVYQGFCGGLCAPGNRTRHVFLTSDSGATWTDISGTDGGNPTPNLPDLPLHSVVMDPGTSPHGIIVASDAAVLRTADLGATWQILGGGFPTVDAKSLAIDTAASPPLLRVGTYGRSVFELSAAVTLTVARNGNGGGTVTSNDGGINCGTTCAETVNAGTTVILTATPAANSNFTGWSGGGCSGTGTCSVTITANTTVTAMFSLRTFALTVIKSGTGSGTVTSGGGEINCGPTCSATFNTGTMVTLTATAAAGSIFTGWDGTGVSCPGTGTCSITLSGNVTVTATFAVARKLTVVPAGTGAGMVTSSPAVINCGSTCTASFADGTQVILTAAANAGSSFVGWSGTGVDCPGSGTCTVTLNADTTVTATFTVPTSVTLTVAIRGSAGGSVATNPVGINCGSSCSSFNSGTMVTLTATPGTQSRFKGWSGACSGTATTCMLTMNSNLSVTATFSMVFTEATSEDLLPAGTTIKAMQFTELLQAINTVKPGANLSWPSTNPAPAIGGTVLVIHMNTLRQALSLEPVVLGSKIMAQQLDDVRLAIRALE